MNQNQEVDLKDLTPAEDGIQIQPLSNSEPEEGEGEGGFTLTIVVTVCA